LISVQRRTARGALLLTIMVGSSVSAPGVLAQAPAGAVLRVVDAASREAILGAQVLLLERNIRAVSGADGLIQLPIVPRGTYTLSVRRLGYAPVTESLTLPLDDSVRVLRLRRSALTISTVVVTGTGTARRADAAFQPTTVLEGAALDRAATMSIAGTLAGEPGITQRTNGPVAAQPVIRGLTGDRVLVLEDGQRMGDLATTAADHQITADPITVRRLEVIRGPAGLLYGSNTLGGVVNIIREDVPRARPDRPTGTIGAQGESNNAAGVVGGVVSSPLGPLAVRADGTWRTAGNSVTPAGVLPFTNMQSRDGGVGVAWTGARGHAGVAVRDFTNTYGVPTSLGGVTLPGAHDGGIYVDLHRTTTRAEAEYRPAGGAISSLAATGNFVRFAQDEREQGGFVGTRFGQLSAQGDLTLRYRRQRGIPATGAIGVFGQWRDLRAAGSFTGTRPAVLRAAALYAYEELTLGRLRLLGGARYDAIGIRPLDSTETRLLRDVRTRRFGAMSGSLAAHVDLARGVALGASLARAFRTPAIEELFSAGPHLASFAYEIGTPTLEAERGTGADLFLRVTRNRFTADLSAFRNNIANFIYYAPQLDDVTGLPMRDPRLRRYVVYRASQTNAVLHGAEGRLQWEPRPGWVADGTLSLVRGWDQRRQTPLPAMPPIRGRVNLRRDTPRWTLGLGADLIAAQNTLPAPQVPTTASCAVTLNMDDEADVLPAEFCRTDAAVLLNAVAGVRLPIAGRLHGITLALDNAAGTLWRDHLWRAKQVAPQPGRNVRLIYRVEF
jgi:iron complex outermembrane recepter protein